MTKMRKTGERATDRINELKERVMTCREETGNTWEVMIVSKCNTFP